MTREQHEFAAMLEDHGLVPNLVMEDDGENWTLIEIELQYRGKLIALTFDPDGKLVAVDMDEA